MPVNVSTLDGAMKDAAVRAVYDTLAKHIVPKSDLHFDNPFELLVAVCLSAHTTDRSVNAALSQLFPIARTPQALLALGVDGVKPFIRPVGLYNNKSKNLIELCRALVEQHGGEVPKNREALEALPGVGRKTANVVLNIAFGELTIAVDTHIHRVANRLGIAKTKTPEQTELVLLKRTPKKHLLNAHHYLILHGRYCCIARKPECWRCPVNKACLFTPKTPTPSNATTSRTPQESDG